MHKDEISEMGTLIDILFPRLSLNHICKDILYAIICFSEWPLRRYELRPFLCGRRIPDAFLVPTLTRATSSRVDRIKYVAMHIAMMHEKVKARCQTGSQVGHTS
jgi:hypothetical protein